MKNVLFDYLETITSGNIDLAVKLFYPKPKLNIPEISKIISKKGFWSTRDSVGNG